MMTALSRSNRRSATYSYPRITLCDGEAVPGHLRGTLADSMALRRSRSWACPVSTAGPCLRRRGLGAGQVVEQLPQAALNVDRGQGLGGHSVVLSAAVQRGPCATAVAIGAPRAAFRSLASGRPGRGARQGALAGDRDRGRKASRRERSCRLRTFLNDGHGAPPDRGFGAGLVT